MLKLLLRLPLFALILSIGGIALAQTATPTPTPPGPTLNSILSRGEVLCGVNQDLPGFGYLDPNSGLVSGFDVDFCRALGAAIFADAAAARMVLYSTAEEGLNALRAGAIDVLAHNVVWSLTLDSNGLEFGPVNFYNGQSIMVQADGGIDEWSDLDGRTVCITAGSTAEARLGVEMARRGLAYSPLPLPTREEGLSALLEGRCDAQSDNRVRLEVLRQGANDPAALAVWGRVDQLYTHEPFAPVYLYGDQQWADIVNWTVLGLIQAEQLGISSENINSLARLPEETLSADYINRVGPGVARLLDTSIAANHLSLPPAFMVAVIREIGNYGEIYERHLGEANGELHLPRTLNSLASQGGLLYAPEWG